MAKNDDKHWLEPPAWWKRWKPLRWLAAGAALAGLASMFWGAKTLLEPAPHPQAAHYQALEPGLALLGPFRSYQTMAEVQAALQASRLEWTQESNHKPPSTRYPPRNLDTLSISGFKHLGTPGELQLEFFNDRLFQATFVPAQAVPYNQRLRKAEPKLKVGRNGKGELIDGSRRVWSNVDHAASPVGRAIRAAPYAIWQDLRLMEQREAWEAAFGSIAVVAR